MVIFKILEKLYVRATNCWALRSLVLFDPVDDPTRPK